MSIILNEQIMLDIIWLYLADPAQLQSSIPREGFYDMVNLALRRIY